MRVLVAMAVAIMSATAMAGPAEDIAEQVSKCWAIPAAAAGLEWTGEYDVTIGAHGAVEAVAPAGFSPDGPVAERTHEAAVLAIERCAPYTTNHAGLVRITLRSADMF